MNFIFLLVAGGIVFLFGLVQWARSGALLWDIHRLLKPGLQSGTADTARTAMDRKEIAREKESLQKSIQKMESMMDSLLKSSFQAMAVLGLLVWLLVAAVVVMDMFNLDWRDRLAFFSPNRSNRVVGSPAARAGFNSGSPARNATGNRSRTETLRQLGSNIRR